MKDYKEKFKYFIREFLHLWLQIFVFILVFWIVVYFNLLPYQLIPYLKIFTIVLAIASYFAGFKILNFKQDKRVLYVLAADWGIVIILGLIFHFAFFVIK